MVFFSFVFSPLSLAGGVLSLSKEGLGREVNVRSSSTELTQSPPSFAWGYIFVLVRF